MYTQHHPINIFKSEVVSDLTSNISKNNKVSHDHTQLTKIPEVVCSGSTCSVQWSLPTLQMMIKVHVMD